MQVSSLLSGTRKRSSGALAHTLRPCAHEEQSKSAPSPIRVRARYAGGDCTPELLHANASVVPLHHIVWGRGAAAQEVAKPSMRWRACSRARAAHADRQRNCANKRAAHASSHVVCGPHTYTEVCPYAYVYPPAYLPAYLATYLRTYLHT